MGRNKREPIERFKEKYVVDENTGCWNWIGSVSTGGYGKFAINKSWIEAHKFSYEYYIGNRIKGLCICHSCNNRKCCNPSHLRQDTHKSNSIDMAISGNQWQQLLSVDQVVEIKKELLNPYYGQCKDLGNIYNVKPNVISLIKRGRNWAHIAIP